MNFTQVREYIRDLLAASFTNKQKLDKIDEDNNGFLVYNNTPVNSPQYGFTPVGTVISLMGNTAPANYLICDGTVYNIADYRALANYFEEQFGSSNHFGGDGTTTFAVPDLRGEFLRGSGTNSRTNQGSGATVGTHQDATEHPHIFAARAKKNSTNTYLDFGYNANNKSYSDSNYDYNSFINPDTYKGRTENLAATAVREAMPSATTSWGAFTSRPTNTSILYCIATKNIYMGGGSNYSTDEQIVGTWVDGKPLYQKTINCGTMSSTTKDVAHNISNLGQVVDLRGVYTISATNEILPIPYASQAGVAWQFRLSATSTLLVLTMGTDLSLNGTVYVTIQYTKTTN